MGDPFEFFNISVAKHQQNWKGDPLKSLKIFEKSLTMQKELKGGPNTRQQLLWKLFTSIMISVNLKGVTICSNYFFKVKSILDEIIVCSL